MHALIDACLTLPIDAILALPDVQERVVRYFAQDAVFRQTVTDCSWTEGSVVISDLRDAVPIPCGNRFLVYALHPDTSNSIWIVNGFQGQNCVFACGHSILNKSSQTHIGALMRLFGGGGHHAAGTCQVPHEDADATLKSLISAMNADTSLSVQTLEKTLAFAA